MTPNEQDAKRRGLVQQQQKLFAYDLAAGIEGEFDELPDEEREIAIGLRDRQRMEGAGQ